MKKLIPVFLALAILTGCSSSDATPTTTVQSVLKNKEYGIYVLNEDETLSPLNSKATMGGDDYEQASFFWWTVDKEKETPTLTPKSKLIAIYDSEQNMPAEYEIEKYQFLGYTIGGNVEIGEDNSSMWISTRNCCADSDMAKSFEKLESSDEKFELNQINDDENLPFSNVDTDINTLIGLEKDKLYKLTIFVGTQTKNANIKADTQIFKSRGLLDLSINPVIKTNNQYFIINLPDNIDKGYYRINEAGIFKVVK